MQSSITVEEINELPPLQFNGEIVMVDNLTIYNKIIANLQKETILGFDTETKPAFQKGVTHKVCLLQLSTDTTCYLFRLHKIGFPIELQQILAPPLIVKAGAATADDIKGLQKLAHFEANNFHDLQKMALKKGITDIALKKMVAIILGYRISKRQKLTNWEAPEITPSQQIYAATDAWVSKLLYDKLLHLQPIAQ